MHTITLGILTTTTHHVEARIVREYLGIIGGDVLVGVTDWIEGGLSAVRLGRRQALELLASRAHERGATVVIAIAIDYVSVGPQELLVTATGTAIRL